jgi:hypothetical protein
MVFYVTSKYDGLTGKKNISKNLQMELTNYSRHLNQDHTNNYYNWQVIGKAPHVPGSIQMRL